MKAFRNMGATTLGGPASVDGLVARRPAQLRVASSIPGR